MGFRENATVELLDLLGIIVRIGEKVDVHIERNRLDFVFLFALKGKAGVETDPPNPSLHVAFSLKPIEAPP